MKILVVGFGQRRGKQIAEQIREMVLRRSFRLSQRVNISFGYSFSKQPSIEFKDTEERDIYKIRSFINRLKNEFGVMQKVPMTSSITCPAVPVKIPRNAHKQKPVSLLANFFEELS